MLYQLSYASALGCGIGTGENFANRPLFRPFKRNHLKKNSTENAANLRTRKQNG